MHAGFNAVERAARFGYDMYRGTAISPGIIKEHAKQSQLSSSKSMPPTSRSRSRSSGGDVVMRGRSKSVANRGRYVTPSPRRSSSMPATPRKKLRLSGSSPSTTRGGVRRTIAMGVSHFKGKIGQSNKAVSKLTTMLKKGVQVCLEQGNVVTSSSSIYIGHASCPARVAKRAFWRALVKLILIRSNKLNPDWNAIPRGVNVGDTWVVEYRVNMDAGTPFSSSVVTWAAGLTQDQIALAFASNFESFSSQFTVDRIEYRPNNAGVGNSTIYLNNAHVELDVLSTFKIQNQTVTLAADDESDNVNNVPLIGKSYQGKGTGTKYQVERTGFSPFICEPSYGIIYKAGTDNDLAEPPSAKLFQQVKKAGKVTLGPGEIKTSTIKYRKRLGMQNFISLIFDLQADLNPKFKLKHLGEFKFYGLEKQIDALAATAENNIKVAYEHDLKFAMMIIPHAQTVTTQLFEQSIGAV